MTISVIGIYTKEIYKHMMTKVLEQDTHGSIVTHYVTDDYVIIDSKAEFPAAQSNDRPAYEVRVQVFTGNHWSNTAGCTGHEGCIHLSRLTKGDKWVDVGIDICFPKSLETAKNFINKYQSRQHADSTIFVDLEPL